MPTIVTALALLSGLVCMGRDQDLNPRSLADLIETHRVAANPFFVTYHQERYDELRAECPQTTWETIRTDATVAFEGARQYTKTHRVTVKGDNSIDMVRTAIYDGERSTIREAHIGSGSTTRIEPGKSYYCAMNHYTSGLMWPVTDDQLISDREKGADSMYLPGMLRQGDWVVSETLEEESGVLCRTLATRDGRRKLWIDPSKSHSLVRYLAIDAVPGFSRVDTRYSDDVEVADGFYLPRQIESRFTNVDSEGREISRFRILLNVSTIQIGPLPNGLFTLPPRVGETVIDTVNNEIYEYHPDDDRLLDVSIASARHGVRLVQEESRRAFWFMTLGAGVALLAGYVVGRWLGRKRRAASHPPVS